MMATTLPPVAPTSVPPPSFQGVNYHPAPNNDDDIVGEEFSDPSYAAAAHSHPSPPQAAYHPPGPNTYNYIYTNPYSPPPASTPEPKPHADPSTEPLNAGFNYTPGTGNGRGGGGGANASYFGTSTGETFTQPQPFQSPPDSPYGPTTPEKLEEGFGMTPPQRTRGTESTSTPKKGWWERKSKKEKNIWTWMFAIIIVIIIIIAVSSGVTVNLRKSSSRTSSVKTPTKTTSKFTEG